MEGLAGTLRTAGRLASKSQAATEVRDAAPARPRLLLPAVASAVLLWACYFPLAWGWLAWVALVPLLCLVRSEARPRKVYGAAWLAGLLFFWAAIQWMRVADLRMYATWAMLATYCSVYFPVAIWLIRRVERHTRLPLVLSVPLLWCGLEFLRSFLLTGFAWYYLGHTQHQFLPLIQIADLGGVYAISFLVAAVNAWLFELCFTQPWFRAFFGLPEGRAARVPALVLQGVLVSAALAATLGYGAWRLSQDTSTPGPRVAVLQGSLDQRLRNEAGTKQSAQSEILRHYAALCQMAAVAPQRPDLIVWPETSFPWDWCEFDLSPGLIAMDIAGQGNPGWGPRLLLAWDLCLRTNVKRLQDTIAGVGILYRTNLLLGLNAEVLSRDGRPLERYCSALLVRPDGSLGGRYDKMHRVPFGEYVPLRDVLPLMDRFAPYDFDYSITPGTHFNRFAVGPYRFGALICFEDTDPFLARKYVSGSGADGADVSFLVNISNDGWFDGTSEHDEHLAICRFRAIETRRAVARAVNMGISAVIDSNGRVLAPEKLPSGEAPAVWEMKNANDSGSSLPLSEWWRFKKVAGVLIATIPIDDRQSFYALWGDWLGWGCLAIAAAAAVVLIPPRRASLCRGQGRDVRA